MSAAPAPTEAARSEAIRLEVVDMAASSLKSTKGCGYDLTSRVAIALAELVPTESKVFPILREKLMTALDAIGMASRSHQRGA